MATKNITDKQVCQAYVDCFKVPHQAQTPEVFLQERTGECEKVCYCAMDRAAARGYIEYGVLLRTGWLTPKGQALLGVEGENHG